MSHPLPPWHTLVSWGSVAVMAVSLVYTIYYAFYRSREFEVEELRYVFYGVSAVTLFLAGAVASGEMFMTAERGTQTFMTYMTAFHGLISLTALSIGYTAYSIKKVMSRYEFGG